MPGMRAALLELALAGQEIELVVRDQDLRRVDLEEAGERSDRLAGEVHVGRRLQEPDGLAADRGSRGEAEVAALGHQRDAQARGDLVDEPEAGVVAGGGVFRARVAEADDQSNHAQIIEACEMAARRTREGTVFRETHTL